MSSGSPIISVPDRGFLTVPSLVSSTRIKVPVPALHRAPKSERLTFLRRRGQIWASGEFALAIPPVNTPRILSGHRSAEYPHIFVATGGSIALDEPFQLEGERWMCRLVRYGGLGRSYVLVRAQNCTGLGEVLIALPSIHFSYELSPLNCYRLSQFPERYLSSTIFGVNDPPSNWEILKNNSKLALAYIKNMYVKILATLTCTSVIVTDDIEMDIA